MRRFSGSPLQKCILSLGLMVLAWMGNLSPAQAIIVVGGGTGTPGVHGTGGFILTNGNPIVDVSHPAYDNRPTAPNLPQSNWVWDPIGGTINAPITFEFDFDLTGFDPNSASLTGLWGVDNVATAFLNGHQFASLPNPLIANFNPMVSLNLTAGSGFFNAGINLLTFQAEDFGPPGAFRTAFLIDAAEISAVPIPAAGSLLLLGLMGFAWIGRRRRFVT